MVVCKRSECGIVAKRLSGCHWDVGWSEGVTDADESEKFVEKLNCHALEDQCLTALCSILPGESVPERIWIYWSKITYRHNTTHGVVRRIDCKYVKFVGWLCVK